MPRGKNYVNNNRGVTMQASKKKHAPSMEQCFYGKGCTREDCFYRHDGSAAGGGEKSAEPCMSFLAGLCTFSAAGCRKRHPPKEETERLVAKYRQMKCRYGKHCKTSGCLYIHPDDNGGGGEGGTLAAAAAFPPLAGSKGTVVPRPMVPTGAWKPMQPTGASMANRPLPPLPQAKGPPPRSAWQPSPPPAPGVWGQNNHHRVLASPAALNNGRNGTHALPSRVPPLQQQPPMRNSDASMLNVNAREFVPGGFSTGLQPSNSSHQQSLGWD